MPSNSDLVMGLEAILNQLLAATKASRTTIRLDIPSRGLHVDSVTGEAVAPGVKSLKNDSSINQRQAATVKWLERERRILVQDDLTDADPPCPPALVAVYETKAQMLGPMVKDDAVFGWISVHHNDGPRHWTQADVGALKQAIEAAHREIGPI